MSRYQKGADSVNPKTASSGEQAQNFSDTSPARPKVAKPRRSFEKAPIDFLAAMVADPGCPLKSQDTLTVTLLCSFSHRLANGQRGLAFPGQALLAKRMGKERHAVMKSLARIAAAGLIIPYKVKMAKGREDGGQRGNNYYDMAPYFMLCGEDVVPRSKKEVEKYIDDAGFWRRGMVIERGDFGTIDLGADEPLAAAGADEPRAGAAGENPSHHVANLRLPEEEPAHRGEAPTMSHKTHSNLTESDIVIGNQTKYNGPKRLRSVADKLGGPEQVVFDRLTSLGYTPWKAAQDLRKYGANYVTRCIDRAKAQKGIQDINCFICSLMGTDLDETETRRRRPVPAPARNIPKRPQASTQSPPLAPKPPQAQNSPQAAPPTRAGHRASLLAEIDGYTAAEHHQARHAMLADSDDRVFLASNPQIAVTDMKLGTLIAFRDRLVRLATARRGREEAEEIFGSD